LSSPIDLASIDLWTKPQARLPLLEEWLTQEVWTAERFRKCGCVPSEYLKSGERIVNDTESLWTASADSYFGELIATPSPARTVVEFFREHEDGCVVLLDGCSVRELPKMLQLAQASRRPLVECTFGRSAIPSSTEHFISDRLGLGLAAISPSQLVSRKELRQAGIKYYFFQSPSESQHIYDADEQVLLWHRFPDLRFLDSTASSAEFYDGVWDTLDLVWQRTVQALPGSRPVLVTSDHGYVFLGPGLSDRNLDGKDRVLKGKRFREFPPDEPLPLDDPGLFVDQERRLVVLKGRCHNRPQAPSPAKSLYRHGAVTLMEVLTPWLVLAPLE
jgi:hypothetical protein